MFFSPYGSRWLKGFVDAIVLQEKTNEKQLLELRDKINMRISEILRQLEEEELAEIRDREVEIENMSDPFCLDSFPNEYKSEETHFHEDVSLKELKVAFQLVEEMISNQEYDSKCVKVIQDIFLGNIFFFPNAAEFRDFKKAYNENCFFEEEEDDYFEEEDFFRDNDRRYDKYGGYNGFSDDAIDDAFEGDPSLTWNVD